jgi:aminodeoxyfutalosine deaminase
MLERQAVELDTIGALLRDEPPAAHTLVALRRLGAVFEHVADLESRADTAGTRALVAIAAGDVRHAVLALGEATRLRPEAVGVAALARTLIELNPRELVTLEAPREPHLARRREADRQHHDRDAELSLAAFVEHLPKVELHLHLEGSIAPATLAALARRNRDLRVPWTPSGVERWYEFSDYRDFLNAHVMVSEQLRRPEDFIGAVSELGAALRLENVRYAEVAVSTDAYIRRGISPDELFAALEEGRQIVETRTGVRLRWCATAGTRRGPSAAMNAVETVIAHRTAGVISFGLAGLESSVARARFAPAFELAADAGLHRVVHAGEATGPASIWQAIDALGAERIGHGIRCLEDAALVEYLRRVPIPLEVCVSSNVRTGIVRTRRAHPLPRLLAAGLAVTLNTDDPAMFKLRLGEEFLSVAKAFQLEPSVVADLSRNAVRAAFIDPADATVILDEIDELVHRVGQPLSAGGALASRRS